MPTPITHLRSIAAYLCVAALTTTLLSSCSNTPYPEAKEEGQSVYYTSFSSPPVHLDPQLSYNSADGNLLAHCYESLLGYSYLGRPLELQPELATAVPKAKVTRDTDGKITEVRYSFTIQEGVNYADDPCFADNGGKGRLVTARDFEYAFHRVSDESVNCPVFDSLAHVSGLREHRAKIKALREKLTKEAVAAGTPEKEVRLNSRMLYDQVGSIPGVQLKGDYQLDVVMDHAYPQILYWLAMRFVCAIPHEAVDYYNGQHGTMKDGAPMEIDQRPVGSGPYQFDWTKTNRDSRIVLKRNPNWWGLKYPDRKAPVAIMPESPGEERDKTIFAWSPEQAGKPIEPPDQIDFRLERESLPRFNKFMQGYYDAAAIPVESFDQVVEGDNLTPDMEERGIRLVKDVGLDIVYIGFNMQDDQIGAPNKFSDPEMEKDREKYLDRNRKLRQAMSLAIDPIEFLRIFNNKLGVPAQSMIPPGIPGYNPDFKNPYRQYDPDLTQAKELLAEAGYANGIDPKTGAPLTFSFVGGNTSTAYRTLLTWFVDQWKRIGLNVDLQLSDYNKFNEKMREGNFQIFRWGWLADYPDPENFMFLMYGPNSAARNAHSPNHACYENPEYDFYFKKMEALRNDESATWTEKQADGTSKTITMTRTELISKLVGIATEDCPWIPINHSEDYVLFHKWATGVKPHPITGGWYRNYRIDHEAREAKQLIWNKPILWPAIVLGVLLIAFIAPAAVTIYKERR